MPVNAVADMIAVATRRDTAKATVDPRVNPQTDRNFIPTPHWTAVYRHVPIVTHPPPRSTSMLPSGLKLTVVYPRSQATPAPPRLNLEKLLGWGKNATLKG